MRCFPYSSPSYRGCALLVLYHLQTLPAHYVLIFQNVCKHVERSGNSQHPGLCVYVHLSTERFSYHLYSKFGAGSESSSRGSFLLGQPHFNLTGLRQEWLYITQISSPGVAGLVSRLCRTKCWPAQVGASWTILPATSYSFHL